MQSLGNRATGNGSQDNSSTGFDKVQPKEPDARISRPARGVNYMLLSMKAVSWDLETAPTLVASTSPPLNSMRVGMPRIP